MIETPDTSGRDGSPQRSPGRLPKWGDPTLAYAVVTITLPLIALMAAWYLLQILTPLVRPLFVAVFLAYVLMPYHGRLRRHIGTPGSIGVLVTITALALFLLAVAVYVSVLGLDDDRPRLEARAVEITHKLEDVIGKAAPWAEEPDANGKPAQSKLAEHVTRATAPLLALAADALLEACVVALYLLFLLLEGSRFPDRVRRAYPPERAEEILDIAGQVSGAIISYLRAKVKSSLVIAIPVGHCPVAGRSEVRAAVGDPDLPVQLHPVHRQRDRLQLAGRLRVPLLRHPMGAASRPRSCCCSSTSPLLRSWNP